MERSYRYRVNVSQTVKGVLTFDATVEAEGDTGHKHGSDQASASAWNIEADILARSDALVAELRRRYPPAPEPEPKEKAKP